MFITTIGGGMLASSVVGGLLGGSGGGSQTQTKEIDPRLAEYVYGKNGTGGLLGDATKIYQSQMKTGGLNEYQRQGLDMQMQYLTSPQYQQSNQQLFNTGASLLGGGIAGNPFTSGQRSFGGSRTGQGGQSFGRPQGYGQPQGMPQRQQNQMMPASQGFQYQPMQPVAPNYALQEPGKTELTEADFEKFIADYLAKQQQNVEDRFA